MNRDATVAPDVLKCECGLVCPSSDPGFHRRVHDEWAHGVKLSPVQTDRLVGRKGPLEILVVPLDAPSVQRRRAQAVAWLANKETHYDFGVYSMYVGDEREHATHAFVARRAGRGIGLLVARRHQVVYRVPWADFGTPRLEKLQPISETANRWTVDFIWVHWAWRRRGVGSLLVQTAARFLETPVSKVAWGVPFEPAGRALAEHVCPGVFYAA